MKGSDNTASIQASIQLQDRMSAVLNNITQSMSLMLNSFEAAQAVTDEGVDAAMMDSARQGIAQATAELVQYREELNRAAEKKIPSPVQLPAQPQVQPVFPPTQLMVQPPMQSWSSASSPVFTNSGAERFAAECQEADLMAQQLYKSQQAISAQAQKMEITPPGMLNDMAAMQNRIQALLVKIQQINDLPVNLRTEKTNDDLEALRDKLLQIRGAQGDLTEAMAEMDISAANVAYNRLDNIVAATERDVRGNIAAQSQFNDAIKEGTGAASGLEGKIKSAVMSAAAAFSVQKIAELSDSVTQTTARLNLMNDGLQSTDELNQKIFASAQRARAPYMETASAIAKMGMNAGNAFTSNDELIAFMEQVNKQFVIGGASAQEQSNAMVQLSQAMAAGALRGEELNSILDAAPGIARTIEQNMGWAEGSIKQYAEKGAVSAQVVKASLLNMAEETNEKFASMPMTFGQVITTVQNTLLQTFWPIIQMIGKGASFINDNWSTIAPIFYGVAAGAVALAIGLGIQAAATWIATGAAAAFFTTLMTNPLTWIVLVIAAVVAQIYKWVQSVGGIRIAWLICVNAVLTQADRLKIGFSRTWMNIQNGIDNMSLGFNSFKAGVLNTLGNLKVQGLMVLQNFINGAIDRVNKLISVVNGIAGTSIELVSKVEFATNAELEEKAKQSQRAADLAAQKEANAAAQKSRARELYWQKYEAEQNRLKREANIKAAQDDAAARAAGDDSYSQIAANTGSTAGNTAKMADSMDVLDEDLKYMRDAAEQEIINRFTLAELKVDVKNSNTLTKKADFDDMGSFLSTFTSEFLASAAEGGHL